jgi:ubiquinone/menaquinone biosynthesis C-methylase UbiE
MALRGFGGHRKRSIDQLGIKDGESVLIVGAGTGLDLEYIPEGAKVTATDITPGMIAKLDKKAADLGIDVESMVMDGQKLEFEDNSFDHVILHLIIAVIPDPVKCIMEVERVLRPGGIVTVFDKFIHKGRRPNLLRRLLNIFTNAFFSDINRSIEDIVSETSLEIVSDIPVAFGGSFRVLLLKKN